ncbi:ras-related protein Rab-39A [Danio aesculapii]|uniref:ras-related protein Rab-39A-like n=1 Tax=Danio aesculapii TaxID=1142201 RepID=UPI0024BF92CD|nr:ras-related protein Rab-39A-like [Danio aesculapii]XP_056331082.1 ras-related protein Rab-39A [Danio aesculapii]
MYHFKIIMIGDNMAGKSSMMYRYRNGCFKHMESTIGVDFCAKSLVMEPGVRVNLQILDTAGHERFWDVILSYIPGSAGCLLVFDLGNRRTFNLIKYRYSAVRAKVHPYSLLFVLVGHKCDREEREVSQEEVEEFASEVGVPYIEASAKTGHNVAEAFELLTHHIYQGLISGEVHLHESWGKIENKNNDQSRLAS